MNAPNTCLRIEETICTPWCEEDDFQKRWIKQKITMLRNNLTFITMWLCSSYIIPGFHGRGWKFFCLVSIQLNFCNAHMIPYVLCHHRKEIFNVFSVLLSLNFCHSTIPRRISSSWRNFFTPWLLNNHVILVDTFQKYFILPLNTIDNFYTLVSM